MAPTTAGGSARTVQTPVQTPMGEKHPFAGASDSCQAHVSAANRAVGAIARRTRLVSPRDIELFTELTGDRNPLHYDEAAGASRFGGLIIQGGITSGLLNAVVAED